MTVEELQMEAFRQIRQKVSDITDESSNDEIAGYIKRRCRSGKRII